MITISVYTRHSVDCRHREDISYRRCDCTKWLYWVQDLKRIRQSAKTRSWEKATELARDIENDIKSGTEKPAATENVITIAKMVDAYLKDKRSIGLKDATLSKLETIFQKRLLEFCAGKGLTRIEQLSTAALTEWRSTWTDGDLARKKKWERVVGFFHFCVNNGWLEISKNPTLRMKRVKVVQKPTDYFPKEEFDKIVDATYAVYDREAHDHHAERVRTLILLSRWSGLRIRDAITLERPRLTDANKLILYMAKTGNAVYVPLPDHVADALREIPPGPKPNPRYFFWSGNGDPKSAVADWQRSLRRVFDAADIKHADGSKKRCHHHMFRDTFAVEMLLAGVPLDQVSILLGHKSIKITEKHYSPWVKARQEQLDESVKKAWTNSSSSTPSAMQRASA